MSTIAINARNINVGVPRKAFLVHTKPVNTLNILLLSSNGVKNNHQVR